MYLVEWATVPVPKINYDTDKKEVFLDLWVTPDSNFLLESKYISYRRPVFKPCLPVASSTLTILPPIF